MEVKTEADAHCMILMTSQLLVCCFPHSSVSGVLLFFFHLYIRMAIFYSQLASGSRPCGHPVKQYKDALKKTYSCAT